MEMLRGAGRYEESLIIVASDHGQALGEHGFWGHGTFLHESLVRVPVVVKLPAGWKRSDVPDTVDTRLSLRWVFDFLEDVATAEGSEDVTFAPESNPARPVIAESHGSPQDVDVSLPDDQSTYSRVFYFDGSRVTHLEAPQRELLWSTRDTDSPDRSEILEIARSKAADLPALASREEELTTMEEETRRQLESLGYM